MRATITPLLLCLPLLAASCSGQAPPADIRLSGWSIGVLAGTELLTFRPDRPRAPLSRVNLRKTWDERHFFRTPLEKERAAGDYPVLHLLASSPEDGLAAINLIELATRDDGPLMVMDVRTSKVRSAIPISDSSAAARFVPGTAGQLLARYQDNLSPEGGARLAVFDSVTGSAIRKIEDCVPPGPSPLFLAKPWRLICVGGAKPTRLMSAGDWTETGALGARFADKHTLLDAWESTLLSEDVEEGKRNLIAWKEGGSPVAIATELFAGVPRAKWFLAGRGDRVIRCQMKAPALLRSYRASDGTLLAEFELGKLVFHHAVHPEGHSVALLVDDKIVLIDVENGKITSRIPYEGTRGERAVFWVKAPAVPSKTNLP